MAAEILMVNRASGIRRTVRKLRNLWANFHAHLQDARHFASASGLLGDQRSAVRAAHVLKTAHRLDKGLALPFPKPTFGSHAARLLDSQLKRHFEMNGEDWIWQLGRDALSRHRSHACGSAAQALSVSMSASQVQAAARGPFPDLVRARRSVRQFAAGALPAGSLRRAAELAAQSPSVCNRSGARVWVATDPEHRRQVLALQDGHQGFGDQASAVAVVTVDMSVFHTVGERHQAWVDGGLFAMTFIYALHHEGLGTCCLNWCVDPKTDQAFKQSLGLAPQETVVMLLAIGRLPERFTVAHSPRRPLSEVLRNLERAD